MDHAARESPQDCHHGGEYGDRPTPAPRPRPGYRWRPRSPSGARGGNHHVGVLVGHGPFDLKPPTREQYALIRQNLPEYYMRLAVFLEETGMRWGEATVLRRCHVDLDADIVKVREVVIDDDGRLMRQAAPKTVAGFRVVPLTPAAVAAVQAMIEKWAPAVTESPIEAGMHPEELIFRSPRSGEKRKVRNEAGELVEVTVERVLNRNNFKRVWLPAIKDAGIARLVKNAETGRNEWWPRVHDYRHALATRLHAQGVSEKDVQLALGQKRGGRVTAVTRLLPL
ncbi:tyrosine-type recombinase/integrase [Streptomyces sp. NPDC014646]|uniref:tyrosine-type recombinase/integrase n=1 Tax=unclassified Streptomyces TaxID=2593676 RepID=UPI0036F6CF6F